MSRPSPVQPFAPRLTRPIPSRHTQPNRLTASQASRRMTPRLTTTLTTAPSHSHLVTPPRTARVHLEPRAELLNIFGGDSARGNSTAQAVSFCVPRSAEALPVVDEARARERRGSGADPDPPSRRRHQQDHCCCQDTDHTNCPAGGCMHAYRLPTNVDCDEAAVVSAVVPSMSST
jgi:hypothetical protein